MAALDIHVNISRQNVRVECDDTSLRMSATNWQSIVPFKDIKFVANFAHGTYIALNKDHLVSPRKKYPGRFVCVAGVPDPLRLPGVQCYDCTDPGRTFLGFAGRNALHVSDGGLLVVCGHDWCEALPMSHVQTVVLQRTTGGMSMFDLAVLPVTSRKLEVDNVPHAMLERLKLLLQDKFVDVGGDPVTPHWDGHEWLVPEVGAESSSDDCSEYDPEAPPSSSSSDESFAVVSESGSEASDSE